MSQIIGKISSKNKQNKDYIWKIYVEIMHEDEIITEQQFLELADKSKCFCDIIVEYGLLGGKQVIQRCHIKTGKNIGKKNETNVYQQALNEAKSKLKKRKEQKKNGYQCMLLHKYKLKKTVFPCIIQPKYNGIRGLSYISQKGSVILETRGKKFIKKMPNLFSQLTQLHKIIYQLFGVNLCLDGELYSFNLSLQEISSLVKRETLVNQDQRNYDEMCSELYYYIFDVIIYELTFEQRLQIMILIQEALIMHEIKQIIFVPNHVISNEEELQFAYQSFIQTDYEGIVIRNFRGKYEKSRSFNVMKLKQHFSNEFKIVGIDCGKRGKDEGLLMWVLETEQKKIFTVRPNMSDDERRKLYQGNGKNQIGKMITLTYMGYTNDNIPYHITECVIRDYE